MFQSAVESTPFRGEDRGPRRPPVEKDRSSDNRVGYHQGGPP